ncbi:TRAP transporter substrate-binding protein [Desulfogranum mediterraneum]|uniref:TRAP transporter substrate-binding protein n=1 Tax=Desulfogranum mediterraneum TaxID=160661 RepID=UPI0004282ABF|nr:TRAP transporter substrate-binding protein [Desulfogranum mediterraneum]
MKRLPSVSILTALILFAAHSVWATGPSKLDLNAVYGASSFHTQGASDFAKRVEGYSRGTVLITVHPGGSLGFKGPELLKVVKDGQVAMSDILMGVVAGSSHVFGISSLPRLVKSYDEAHALYLDAKPLYEKAAQKWNQKLLYAAPWPPSGLVTKKMINSSADIQGSKTRTYDKNGAEFLKAMGGMPLSMPWGEVYASLRTGMIDSVLTSTESAKNGKFWEVLNNFKPINYAYPLNMVCINLDYWHALSPEQQEAMLKAAADTEAAQWANSQTRSEEAQKIIEQNGIKVSQEDAAFAAELDAAARKIQLKFLKKAKKAEAALLNRYLN